MKALKILFTAHKIQTVHVHDIDVFERMLIKADLFDNMVNTVKIQ